MNGCNAAVTQSTTSVMRMQGLREHDTDMDKSVETWQRAVIMWSARYAIAKRRLEYFEAENGNTDSPERRVLIGKVNETQQQLESAQYVLQRRENGL